MDKTGELTKEELEGFKKAVMEGVALAEKATGNSETIEFAKRLIKGFNRLFSHITALEGERDRACQEAQEATPAWMHERVVNGNKELQALLTDMEAYKTVVDCPTCHGTGEVEG